MRMIRSCVSLFFVYNFEIGAGTGLGPLDRVVGWLRRNSSTGVIDVAVPHTDSILPPDEYLVGNEIGSSKTAKVFEVIELSTNNRYAAKVMKKDVSTENTAPLANAVPVLVNLDYPHIVKLHSFIKYQGNEVLLMEYCDGGDLFDHIKGKRMPTEDQAKVYFKQIVQAVVYMHERGIVHRDLKLDNVFVCEGILKVGDFDSAVFVGNDGLVPRETPLAGTPGYMAPEVWDKVGYGFPADVYSLGVLLYVMLVGNYPFDPALPRDYQHRKPIPKKLSENAKDLLKKLRSLSQHNRLPSNGILSHPWFATIVAQENTIEE